MLYWISAISAGVVTFSLAHYWLKFRVWRSLGVAGPTPWPLIGNIPDVIAAGGDMQKLDSQWAAKYGQRGYWGYYSGSTPTLMVTDPELIKEIFVKKFEHFPNRLAMMEGVNFKFLDQDLVWLRDEKWKRARNALSPTLTGSKLKDVVGLVSAIGRHLAAKLAQMAERNDSRMELYSTFKYVTVDMICQIAFGTCVDSMNNPDDPVANACLRMADCWSEVFKKPLTLLAVMFRPWAVVYSRWDSSLGLDFSYLSVIDRVVSSLYQRWKDDEHSVDSHFLRALFGQRELYEKNEGKEGLSHETVVGNTTIFVLGGFQTTATLMQWTCYYLAKYPEIQCRVASEIRDLVTDPAHPEYEEVSKLTFLDNVIYEVLRFTPVFRHQREAKEDTELSNGLIIKKGWAVETANWPIHMDPKIWGDPLEFRPERFSGEEAKVRSPFAFNAFGHGPRQCIGMRLALFEVKFALVSIFSSFEVKLSPETPEVLKLKLAKSVEPQHPIIVNVSKRV